MKIIELTGIPGSGKSTILPIVQHYLQNIGYRVFNSADTLRSVLSRNFKNKVIGDYFFRLSFILPDKVYTKVYRHSQLRHDYQLKYICENTDFVNYVVRQTYTRPIPESHKSILLQRFLFLAGIHRIAIDTLDRDSILILDEGYIHRAISFFISNEEKEIPLNEVDTYLSLIPRVNLLLTVHADRELCQRRIIERKLPLRLRERSGSEISDYLIKTQELFNYLSKSLTEKKMDIISLDNNRDRFSKQNILTQFKNKYSDIQRSQVLPVSVFSQSSSDRAKKIIES